MKIKIDLDSFGKELNSIVAEQLDSLKYPVCLGTQAPIIMDSTFEIESDDFIDVIFNVPYPQRSLVNMEKFTDDPILSNKHQYILTKEGEDSLENTKRQMANKYTKKLVQCMECRLFEKCSLISTNYLLSIIVKNTTK